MAIRLSANFAPALALAALLPACGVPTDANVDSHADALAGATCSVARDVLFQDEFDTMANLNAITAPVAGHAWAVMPASLSDPSALRSDPDGTTIPGDHNRVKTASFSLEGHSQSRVVLRASYQLSGDDLFQVFASDGKKTILIGDLRSHNAAFPAYDEITLNLSAFDGAPSVYLLIDRTTGPSSSPAFGVAIDSLKVTGRPALASDVVFFDDFESGLSQWRMDQSISVGPASFDGNHSWALKSGALCDGFNEFRSDPIGATRPGVHNRAVSKSFSLAGKCQAVLKLQDRHSLFGNDIYSIQVQDGASTYLVGDYRGQNPEFPGYQNRTIDISSYVAGKPSVNLAITVISGNVGSGFGVGIDNVQVVATDCP